MTGNTATSLKIIARWVAVLPGAVLCAFAAQFPIHWTVLLIHYFGTHTDKSGATVIDFPLAALPVEVLEYFANALFMPFIIIAVGARIAPNFKLQTGMVLAILAGLFIGMSLPQIASDIAAGLYTPGRWLRLAVTVVLWAISFSWGIYSAHLQAKELRTQSAA